MKKKILQTTIRLMSRLLSIIPTSNSVVFHSFPDLSDNAFALFKYMCLNRYADKYTMIWLVDHTLSMEQNRALKEILPNVIVYKRKSLKAFWAYIRARYVFVTHGLFSSIKLNQHTDKFICLWHGMPLKHIGLSIGNGVSCSPNADYTIATSDIFRGIMSEAFGIDKTKVLITGQPRCDLLFENTDYFRSHHIDTCKYKKIGIWMPTFRKSVYGGYNEDGCYADGSISFLTSADLVKLDDELNSLNHLLLIKIHPMDVLVNHKFEIYNNIIIIKPAEFKSQLYPLLGSCDYLLTDYSSVFIDYLITEKPIGFVMNDINEYANSRGFYFDKLTDILPGPIIQNVGELITFLKTLPQAEVSDTFNKYKDKYACKRVMELLDI